MAIFLDDNPHGIVMEPEGEEDMGPVSTYGYVGPSILLTLLYLFALACIGYAVLHSRGIL